ncbi:MAG: hypothetical protein JO023_18935 [Chloroflexi bacterium]|nr:hypothetical protein [Chloroflexota bacterium]
MADGVARSTEPAISLTPYPDALLDALPALAVDPAADYELRGSVQLAFLAAVQLLPPRQRAVLILRDVVGFSSDAVADLLDTTPASVNSALNRARTSLAQQRAVGRLTIGRITPPDDVTRSLVSGYVEAWRAKLP